MSYGDIRDYLRRLLKQAENNPQQVQIDRSVIDPDRICSVQHSKLAGLQVADTLASGFHFAVDDGKGDRFIFSIYSSPLSQLAGRPGRGRACQPN